MNFSVSNVIKRQSSQLGLGLELEVLVFGWPTFPLPVPVALRESDRTTALELNFPNLKQIVQPTDKVMIVFGHSSSKWDVVNPENILTAGLRLEWPQESSGNSTGIRDPPQSLYLPGAGPRGVYFWT